MDRIDDAYNGLMGEEFMRKTRERLHWICSKVNGETVMDVGCSQGTLARLLASLGKSVTGIDINKDAIAYAEARLGEEAATSRERIRFVASNFMDYKSADRFDTVVMGEILEHLPAPEAFIKQAWTHLTPGGTLVATVPFGINDDPDHRQTFYWSWIRELVAPFFDIAEVRFFGKWIGVVGTKRERKASVEKAIPLSAVKELERAFYAIERPLVNDVKARDGVQKARADKAVADYAKLKTDLTSEIAKLKDAEAKTLAAKTAADAAAAKQKTVLEGEVARQKTALAAEQAKTKDLNAKLVAARNELASVKNEAFETKINLEAERRMSGGQSEQIAVLKAALQLAANRPQIEMNETRLLEYSQEVRELRTALDARRDEAVSRAEQLGRLSGELQALKIERDHLSRRVSELADELAAQSETAEESRGYAKLCEEDNARLAARNKELSGQIGDLSAGKAELEKRLSALEDENASKDEAIGRIANARTELEREVAILKGELRELESSRDGLRKDLAAAAAAVETARDEAGAAKSEVGRLSGLLDRARHENAQLRNAVEDAKSGLAKAETRRGDLSLQLETALKALDGLRQERDAESAKCAELRNEQDGLKNSNDVLNGKFASVRKELAAVESDLARERLSVKKAQDEKCVLEASNKKAEEASQKTVDSLKKTIDAQKSQIDDAQKQIAELRQSLADLSRRHTELKIAKTKAVRLYNEKAAKLKEVSGKYKSLANSKLGRLTLAWRRMKEGGEDSHSNGHGDSGGVMSMPVSVIIPTYKDNPYIDKAVQSVLVQNYPGELSILLCVNGGDKAYAKKLKQKYSKAGNVKVLATPRSGANAGRNLGLSNLKTPLFTFLDDDDYFTPGYVRELARGFVDDRVNISTGRMEDLDDRTGAISNTYYTDALRKAGEQFTTDYYAIGSIFGTFCMKMYRTSFFKSAMGKLNETYRHSEDVMFWAEHFGSLDGPIFVADPDGDEAYIRRKTGNSLSRPSTEDAYRFHVSDRLAMICEMGRLLLNPAYGRQHKDFLISKIKTQTNIIKKYCDSLVGEVAERARLEIFGCECPFLNKAVFSRRTALAFCHNFSPWVDASAFVATKRLGEISRLEGGPLQWHVVKQNMRKIRQADMAFQIYYADFTAAEQIVLNGGFGFAPAAQQNFAEEAFKKFKDVEAEVIYSRALFVGSHMAACKYKKSHPQTKWYAEFSDPLSRGVDDKPRPCTGAPGWEDIEQLVYDNADAIIFTNKNQLEYMLSYNPRPEMNESIRRRAIIMRHPEVPHEYCNLFSYDYRLDAQSINIGFFGTFYVTRKADEILNLLSNPKVVLHIFTTKPEELHDTQERYGKQIRINSTISHFEFLNLATRLDYLVLNDTAFPGAINPFLPSKYSDYLATRTKIIAKVEKGSALSQEVSPQLVKVEAITPDFARALKKVSARG